MEVTDSAPHPHVVLFPFACQGHVRPLLQLARRLAYVYEFKVTFVTTSYIYKRLRLANATRAEGSVQFVDLQEGLTDSYYTGDAVGALIVALTTLGPLIREVVERIHREFQPITCVISDMLFVEAHKAALHFGIPSVAFSSQSALALSAKYYGRRLVEQGLLPLPKRPANMGKDMRVQPLLENLSEEEKVALGKVVTCVPGMCPMKLEEYHTGLLINDTAEPFFQYFVGEHSTSLHEREWVLANTFHELEAPIIEGIQQDAGVNMCAIGPLAIAPTMCNGAFVIDDEDNKASSYWPEETKCMGWLSTQKPVSVIYVSFGSLAKVSSSALREILLGLENSQVPFLIAIRPDLLDGSGGNETPQSSLKSFQERTKDRALVVSWTPQLRVLSHPAIAGFLTHCGWNSMLESISMGVPMLCYPSFVDQPMNNRYIVSVWKIGLELEVQAKGFVERIEVANKIRALVAHESNIRMNAYAWKDAARRAVENGGSSQGNMAAFVADMIKRAQASSS